MATSFSGGGSRSTRKEPPTMGKQLVNFITCDCESSAPFLAHLAKDHVSFCHHLASVVRRKLSHLNLLLRNHWANCNQTLVEWSLGGPLPKLYPVIQLPTNMAAKLKIGKNGDEI
jgi:hypothetical protein